MAGGLRPGPWRKNATTVLALLAAIAFSSSHTAFAGHKFGPLFPVWDGKGRAAYIDSTGRVAIEFRETRWAEYFSEGRASILENELMGFIDETGKVVVRARFLQVFYFHEGRSRVQGENGKWGFSDVNGQMVIAQQFDEADDFSEGLAAAKVGSQWGYINQAGQFVIPPKYAQRPGAFSNGRALLSSFGPENGHFRYTYIDKSGNKAVEFTFPVSAGDDLKIVIALEPFSRVISSRDFSEGLAPITVDGMSGYMDTRGKVVIPARFESAGDFSEGMAPVQVEGKVGYIDKTGVQVILPRFEAGREFSEGLAAVRSERKWGYIDRTGNFVIAPRFETAQEFMHGLARVEFDPEKPRKAKGRRGTEFRSKCTYVDQTGRLVWKPWKCGITTIP